MPPNYPTPVPTPTLTPQVQQARQVLGANTNQVDWGSLWNRAWNEGYNNSTGSNPYVGRSGGGYDIGQAYSLGQQAYAKNKAAGSGSTPTRMTLLTSDPNQPVSDADAEARRREEEARNTITSGYSSYVSGLQGMIPSLQSGQEEELGSASKTYEQIFGGLSDQKTANLSKLEANKGEVNRWGAQSVKDLKQNLSEVLRGATMQFGAMGAGDTSATRVMLPYAYTKLAGQQEGSISRQANDQLFQIDQQVADTNTQYSQMWRQTEVDKENQLQNIKNYYGDAIRNVQAAITQAPLNEAQDLASLSQALLSEAQANLRQLESESRQRLDTIKNWAIQRMSDLNNLKLQLSGSANFQPQDILWSELQTVANPQTGGQEAFYNPLLLASKKRSEYLG